MPQPSVRRGGGPSRRPRRAGCSTGGRGRSRGQGRGGNRGWHRRVLPEEQGCRCHRLSPRICQTIEVPPPHPAERDQPREPQDAQVMGHRLLAHADQGAEAGDASLAPREPPEDLEADGVADRVQAPRRVDKCSDAGCDFGALRLRDEDLRGSRVVRRGAGDRPKVSPRGELG
jgi:hypothetical protein